MMKAEINLITIWTNNIEKMKNFYNQVLGFKIECDLGSYIEFENNGVRFAICLRNVMDGYSNEYSKKAVGQSLSMGASGNRTLILNYFEAFIMRKLMLYSGNILSLKIAGK